MKLKTKSLPAAPTIDERLAEQEARFSQMSEALAEAELALSNLRSNIDEVIREKVSTFVRSFVEMRDIEIAKAEDAVVFRVLEFFQQCPFWELKKLPHSEHSVTNASDNFSKLIKEGWRYVGHYHNPKPPHDRYDLLVRPEGKALLEGEYVKQYTAWQLLREKREAEARKKPVSKSEPEVSKEKPSKKDKKAKTKK